MIRRAVQWVEQRKSRRVTRMSRAAFRDGLRHSAAIGKSPDGTTRSRSIATDVRAGRYLPPVKTEMFQRLNSMPPIVRIVIAQAVRARALGGINERIFSEQMNRLRREELEPKGLTLLARDLPGGRTRILLKEMAGGAIRDMLDFAFGRHRGEWKGSINLCRLGGD